MKRFTSRQALLLAFVVSASSLSAILGIVALASVRSKQPLEMNSANINAEVAIEGRRVFVRHCAECHGVDARGDGGPDLHKLSSGDRLISQIITGGIKGEMPAYGETLNDVELRALVDYLRTLRN